MVYVVDCYGDVVEDVVCYCVWDLMCVFVYV